MSANHFGFSSVTFDKNLSTDDARRLATGIIKTMNVMGFTAHDCRELFKGVHLKVYDMADQEHTHGYLARDGDEYTLALSVEQATDPNLCAHELFHLADAKLLQWSLGRDKPVRSLANFDTDEVEGRQEVILFSHAAAEMDDAFWPTTQVRELASGIRQILGSYAETREALLKEEGIRNAATGTDWLLAGIKSMAKRVPETPYMRLPFEVLARSFGWMVSGENANPSPSASRAPMEMAPVPAAARRFMENNQFDSVERLRMLSSVTQLMLGHARAALDQRKALPDPARLQGARVDLAVKDLTDRISAIAKRQILNRAASQHDPRAAVEGFKGHLAEELSLALASEYFVSMTLAAKAVDQARDQLTATFKAKAEQRTEAEHRAAASATASGGTPELHRTAGEARPG